MTTATHRVLSLNSEAESTALSPAGSKGPTTRIDVAVFGASSESTAVYQHLDHLTGVAGPRPRPCDLAP